MDIFETLRSLLGCMYISDLKFRPYKDKAIEILKELKADSNQKAYALNYIMGGI
jgi:hypothetical protein